MWGMDSDESYRLLTAALRAAEERAERAERKVASLAAELGQLIDVLVGRGGLAEGHRALLERVGGQAAAAVPRQVKLRVLVDKYQVPSADIDCAARLHLCKARCCSFSFDLTTQDLDEGVVMWDAARPYSIRQEADGWCSHLARPDGGCTVYEARPATCRGFDCRGDDRIWIDFEQRIPAP